MEKIQEKEPSTEIRQKLVDTATEFLNMDRILVQPESMKRQFLEKKGLTKEEIEMAFQQFQIQPSTRNQMGIPVHTSSPQNVFIPPNGLPIRKTIWTKLRDSVNMIIFLSGMAFGIKYLYKYYMRPFITGQNPKSEEENHLEVQKSVMGILQQIELMLEKINKNILDCNQKKLQGEAVKIANSSSVQDLKAELNTIKSLLINKKSFPSAPSSHPSIPEWQKRTQLQAEDSQEKENTCAGKVVADLKDFVEEGGAAEIGQDAEIRQQSEEPSGEKSSIE